MRSFAFVAVCVISGCSLFVGLDGLEGGGAADAGANDATPTDGATSDAPIFSDGGDGAVDKICPAGSLFCDDFETGDFSKWGTVSSATSPGIFEVSGGTVWRGNEAMHALTSDPADAGSSFDYHTEKSFHAISSGDFALRAYIFAPQTPFYGSFFLLGHGATSGQSLVVGVNNDSSCLGANPCIVSSLVGGADYHETSIVSFPSGKWVCFEWVVTVGTNGHVAAYVDGSAVLQGDHDTSDPGGGYTGFSAGLQGAVGGEEIFVDDVTFGTTRIGCE